MHSSPDLYGGGLNGDVMMMQLVLQVSQGMVGQLAARRAAGIVLEMVKVCNTAITLHRLYEPPSVYRIVLIAQVINFTNFVNLELFAKLKFEPLRCHVHGQHVSVNQQIASNSYWQKFRPAKYKRYTLSNASAVAQQVLFP